MSLEDYLNTSEGMIGELIDDAAAKVQWARQMATSMLEHAASLEQRAESYRHLAAIMILEAQSYAEDVGDLLTAEFPTDGGEETEETDEA